MTTDTEPWVSSRGSEALAAESLDVGAGQADVVELGVAQRAQHVDRAPGVVPGPQLVNDAREGGDDAVNGDCAERRNGGADVGGGHVSVS